MKHNFYFVYILSNSRNTVLYIGITSDLNLRLWQHKNGFYKKAFTSRYGVDKLIYFEIYESPFVAIKREKILKKWKREWKFNLIRKKNFDLADLSDRFVGF
ncbi:MAG TPA: GIY-YIG nuclease family protein [bacterium]|nr:GIY-YIG nuclease family protein [bacterium]